MEFIRLINDIAQDLKSPIDQGALEDFLRRNKESPFNLRNASEIKPKEKKIEQIMSDLSNAKGEASQLEQHAQKFEALLAKFKTREKKQEISIKAIATEKVAPQQKKGTLLKTYLSFAEDPANEGKIIVNVRGDKVETGRCVLAKQPEDDYIATIGEEKVAFHLSSKKQEEIIHEFLDALSQEYGEENVKDCFSEEDREEIFQHGLSTDKIKGLIEDLENFTQT